MNFCKIALKCSFRDNNKTIFRYMSANFLLIHELDPLPNNNHNFFGVPLSNHIPADIKGSSHVPQLQRVYIVAVSLNEAA